MDNQAFRTERDTLGPVQVPASRLWGAQKGAYRRNVHGCGEGVIGALGHIDVVVGVDGQAWIRLGAEMGNHLVHIHVGLGAAAGLPNL